MRENTQPTNETRRKLAADPHRPTYHFLPPANWMNDPNGLIQWRGRYHLFYQHNPHGPIWAAMHWGHAYSDDLIHWHDAPVALAPTPDGPDKDGVWSGCMVDDNGTPTIIYTAVAPETQCIATGSDDLMTWHRHPANPVIPTPPDGLKVGAFRDPCVWQDDEGWYMALGASLVKNGTAKGAVLLYRGRDLTNWSYVGPLFVGDGDETGDTWECPSFFTYGGRQVLIVSKTTHSDVLYFTGDYANHRFTPSRGGMVDYGAEFFAPQTFTDSHGRRLMFGWLLEGRDEDACIKAGWAGVMTLPRVLSLDDDSRLVSVPAPELEALRDTHHHATAVSVEPGKSGYITEIRGDALEISVTFARGEAEAFGVVVRQSPDGHEETRIFYDAIGERVVINRRRASLSATVQRETIHAPLPLKAGGTFDLRVFVDRSVIEVYADSGRAILSARVYPTRSDSTGIDLFSDGDVTHVHRLDVWTMKPIWPVA